MFKPVLGGPSPTWRAIKHCPLPQAGACREQAAGLAPVDRRVVTVEVTLGAELNDLNYVCKKMTQRVFSTGCGAWYEDAASGRVTAMHPDSQIELRRRLTFPNWADLVYATAAAGGADGLPHARGCAAPSTMPWWKWYGNRVLGLGTLPTVDRDDPAIAYARPYGSRAAALDDDSKRM